MHCFTHSSSFSLEPSRPGPETVTGTSADQSGRDKARGLAYQQSGNGIRPLCSPACTARPSRTVFSLDCGLPLVAMSNDHENST
ncbi:hypothetical protein RRG08_025669 [Elysia crispata]|uniref:Uncharacterized protein n=1 Tax=Elysia crispata TaxID=231223 RepID=A0AAE0YEE6_9GAST|nr:hypothetical protein RRG08_025669 [Elysia crispata]